MLLVVYDVEGGAQRFGRSLYAPGYTGLTYCPCPVERGGGGTDDTACRSR